MEIIQNHLWNSIIYSHIDRISCKYSSSLFLFNSTIILAALYFKSILFTLLGIIYTVSGHHFSFIQIMQS